MIGIDPLDLKAMQDHHDRQLAKLRTESDASLKTARELAGVPVVFAATSSDKRVIELAALFNRLDERGRQTALRMLSVMPYKEAT